MTTAATSTPEGKTEQSDPDEPDHGELQQPGSGRREEQAGCQEYVNRPPLSESSFHRCWQGGESIRLPGFSAVLVVVQVRIRMVVEHQGVIILHDQHFRRIDAGDIASAVFGCDL